MRAPFPLRRIVAERAVQRRSAGFTLVELMVAMTGGLFLSIIVFALSRDASRFYQRESRVANATLAGVSGFERLSNDVARAGHMSTPNIDVDPHVCNRPDGTWPSMLRRLRAILVEDDAASSAATEVGAAGISPKRVTISGALTTPEVLKTTGVVETATGWEITLNLVTPSAMRLGLDPVDAAKNLVVMQSVFLTSGGTGRIVRLRSKGLDQYAVVASVATTPGIARVNLAPAPLLRRLTGDGAQCGIRGNGTDVDVTVIDLVRYNIRSMVTDPAYAALFKASGLGTGGGPGVLPYEGKRAELVRVELSPDGEEIASTREIVGEYAVDLQLSAWRAETAQNPNLIAVVDPINDTYPSTQLIRGVNVRLSVRSREADRDRGITIGGGGSANDIYRIPLGASKGAPFARVRTFQSNIALRNMENGLW